MITITIAVNNIHALKAQWLCDGSLTRIRLLKKKSELSTVSFLWTIQQTRWPTIQLRASPNSTYTKSMVRFRKETWYWWTVQSLKNSMDVVKCRFLSVHAILAAQCCVLSSSGLSSKCCGMLRFELGGRRAGNLSVLKQASIYSRIGLLTALELNYF